MFNCNRVYRVGLIGLLPMLAWAQSAPRLFYSDLESGPNTGGENNKGVFVTVYGKNFGATRGTAYVTVGGGQADNYPLWSDTKICFQLGAAAATGNIIVTTSLGASNSLPFTVRSGNIYFVSPSGSDSANGSFSTPWLTITKARGLWVAGDTIYLRNGFAFTGDDGAGWNATFSLMNNQMWQAGTAGRPIAIVAYPGATATIGGTLNRGIRTQKSYYTFAGLTIRGTVSAFVVNGPPIPTGIRVIANDLVGHNQNSQTGCVGTDNTDGITFLGNLIHDCGTASSDKQDHSMYLGQNTVNAEVAWNTFRDNKACYGIQVHSTAGANQYGINIHDNLFVNQTCAATNLATINPAQGTGVKFWNNVITTAGRTVGTDGGSASCLYFPGYTNQGTYGSGAAQVYNNTFYNCGADGAIVTFKNSTNHTVVLTDNVVQTTGAYLWTTAGMTGGSNNLWFGNGNGPTAGFTANVNADPRFVSAAGGDFHLQSASPAINAGVATAAGQDYDGVTRPQGAAMDIGAFEYQSATVVTSRCDVNKDGSVSTSDPQWLQNLIIGSQSPNGSGDLNGDGSIDVLDLQILVNVTLGTMACPS